MINKAKELDLTTDCASTPQSQYTLFRTPNYKIVFSKAL